MNEMIIGCIMRRVDGEQQLSRLVVDFGDKLHFKYMSSGNSVGIGFSNIDDMFSHLDILNRYDNEYTFVPSTSYQYSSLRASV